MLSNVSSSCQTEIGVQRLKELLGDVICELDAGISTHFHIIARKISNK